MPANSKDTKNSKETKDEVAEILKIGASRADHSVEFLQDKL